MNALTPAVLLDSASLTPSDHPDAELIAACAEYLHRQRTFEARYAEVYAHLTDDDPVWAILDPVPALIERIVALRAVTPDGHTARARCAAFHFLPTNPSCKDDPDGAMEDRFHAAGLRDLVAMERPSESVEVLGKTAAPPSLVVGGSPDAIILHACASFQHAYQEVVRIDAAETVSDEENTASAGALHDWLTTVAQWPAFTPRSQRAKAQVCLAVLEFDRPEVKAGRFNRGGAERHDVLVQSLLRDLTRTPIPVRKASEVPA